MKRRNRKNKKVGMGRRTRGRSSKYVQTRPTPRGPTYTKRGDVVDYLSEDEEIPRQKYVNLSFAEIENEDQLEELRMDVSGKLDVDVDLVTRIVNQWMELYNSKRGLKVRGVYEEYSKAEEGAEYLREVNGKNFHIWTAGVGKWLPFNPDPEKMQDEDFYEQELNNLIKSKKINARKKKMHFEKMKRERMEKAILEGTPEGQQLAMEEEEKFEAVEWRAKTAADEIEELELKIETMKQTRSLASAKMQKMISEGNGPKSKDDESPEEETKDIATRVKEMKVDAESRRPDTEMSTMLDKARDIDRNRTMVDMSQPELEEKAQKIKEIIHEEKIPRSAPSAVENSKIFSKDVLIPAVRREGIENEEEQSDNTKTL